MVEIKPLAVIDLGSNSFRMEIGKMGTSGRFERTEYRKEPVRLGGGLGADQCLSPQVMSRGLTCLADFRKALTGFAPSQVRAVTTQTLREAKNRDAFLADGEKALGFPIKVITGQEEATLIYQGVSYFLPDNQQRRLVVDIGGRSTELIVGRGSQPQTGTSLPMGSVSWSMRFFPNGQLSNQAFVNAKAAALDMLCPLKQTYGSSQWDIAYGSSGTASATAEILLATQRVSVPENITLDGLEWLENYLIKSGNIESVQLPGLRIERKPVIAGGLAVLLAVFDTLGIECMQHATGALRHGVLLQMLTQNASASILQ
jgi:exopolyphosphatase/guanosine-5'-triphosphate,3'-diphosphate pyrophosphatase